MKYYIGHQGGFIVFATKTPSFYVGVAAPDGVTLIDVDDATYDTVAPTVGQLKFRVIGEAIVPIPEKPSEFYDWDWPALEWKLPSGALDAAKAKQSALLNSATQATIFAGFDSAALGTAHHYPAKMTDQGNLVASVTASLYAGLPADWMTPFWCESGGAWSYAMHTAAQIQQAGADGKAAILSALTRNEGLQQQVQAATSIEQVQAIVW